MLNSSIIKTIYEDFVDKTGLLTLSCPDLMTQFLLYMFPVMFRETLHNLFLSHQDLRPHQTPSQHAMKIAYWPNLLYFCTASAGTALHNICAWNPALPWKDLTSLHEDSHQHSTAIEYGGHYTSRRQADETSTRSHADMFCSIPIIVLLCVSVGMLLHCTTSTIINKFEFLNVP